MQRFREWLGRLLNAFGLPGFVRQTRYDASIADVSVRVEVGPRFTVMTVNGIDVYFSRLSGRLEGVGLSQSGHRWAVTPRENGLGASVWPECPERRERAAGGPPSQWPTRSAV